MKFVQAILKRPMSVILLILAVVVYGVSALTSMPLEYFPDIDMPMELVMITWAGADSDSVDRQVTQPIEEECETLTNIDSVISYSFDNYAMVALTYNYGTDLDDAYSDLKSSLDNLMSDLPDDVGDPLIMELSADFISTMVLSATAPEGMDVAQYLNDEVAPQLESLGDVAQVEVTGAQDQYVRIVLDEAALDQYGLSISAVASAIAAADFDLPVGNVTLGTQDIALGVYGNLSVGPDFVDLPIQTSSGQTVLLGDICTFLNLYEEEADSISRYNGQDSVMLSITKQDSAATVEMCNEVLDVLESYEAEGLSFRVIYSEGDSILDTLSEVLQTLIIGVVLTMIVLFVFFGDFRASLIVAISMPLSILLAVILLNQLGYAIDLMTGTSLIIAIGMIVDNSIVILESCFRAQETGLDYHDAAAQGTSSMLMSILAGTLTTIVVYIPLAMADGMMGMMASPLSWTILLCMSCSFISAVVVVPLAFAFLRPHARQKLPINRLLGWFQRGYRRVMPSFLRHPGRVVALGLAAFIGAILLMTQMEFVMMPSTYDGSISLSATFRSGTKLEVIDEDIQEIEQALLADDNFENVTLSVSDNVATFTAYAADDCRRSSEEAVEEYTALFGSTANMEVEVTPSGTNSMSSMIGSSTETEIDLLSDDLESLEIAAGQVAQVMRETPGVIRVDNEFDQSRVKGKIVIDSQKALALGTSESTIAMQVYYILNGVTATTVTYDGVDYDVVLEYPEGKYDDITALMDCAFSTTSGQMVTLRDIADVEYVTALPSISRQDGQYSAAITATTTDAAKYTAADAIEEAVAALDFPAGVTLSEGTMASMTEEETGHVLTALASAIFLVFLVMAIQFNSPRLSIMVMLCIPLSLIGSILLVFLTGEAMSLVGLMGFLMLVGIVVNNGIYLIDGISDLRQRMPLEQALVEAGVTRLRPILMTTLTTCMSMVPMIFATDSGMMMMSQMAYIIIGGLIASTLLAMFLMPSFYLLIRRERLDGTKKGRRHKKERPQTPAEAPAASQV